MAHSTRELSIERDVEALDAAITLLAPHPHLRGLAGPGAVAFASVAAADPITAARAVVAAHRIMSHLQTQSLRDTLARIKGLLAEDETRLARATAELDILRNVQSERPK
ncbi:hypothetical protein HDU84_006565 [Entophlyctis sp. JEL0112]|nr:hypothetical protein HDU84_006565 [Entophlyctis sp. JEL0112]